MELFRDEKTSYRFSTVEKESGAGKSLDPSNCLRFGNLKGRVTDLGSQSMKEERERELSSADICFGSDGQSLHALALIPLSRSRSSLNGTRSWMGFFEPSSSRCAAWVGRYGCVLATIVPANNHSMHGAGSGRRRVLPETINSLNSRLFAVSEVADSCQPLRACRQNSSRKLAAPRDAGKESPMRIIQYGCIPSCARNSFNQLAWLQVKVSI